MLPKAALRHGPYRGLIRQAVVEDGGSKGELKMLAMADRMAGLKEALWRIFLGAGLQFPPGRTGMLRKKIVSRISETPSLNNTIPGRL